MVSPGGFVLAIAVLIVVWIFLPPKAQPWLALLLVLSVLSSDKKPGETIKGFFGRIK